MNKYHARRCEVDGYKFDSQAEARRYGELKLLARTGEVEDLEVHPHFVVQPAYILNGKKKPAITYVADFSYHEMKHQPFDYMDRARLIVEDVKGAQTPVFRLKAKMFERQYPDCELRLVAAQ